MLTEQRPATRTAEIADLRDWLERVEEMGELRRITKEVDPIEEMGAITYMVGKHIGSPALLFVNIGTYRMMVQSKNEVGLYLSPGKHARLDITRAWEQGHGIDVAACWGIDPLFMVVGAMGFPKNVSEYEFAGGIRNRAIEVFP